jgi:hypothetical protein
MAKLPLNPCYECTIYNAMQELPGYSNENEKML